MVNGLHLYSAFIDLMATKALYILPHIHPFTHTFIHFNNCYYYNTISCFLIHPNGVQQFTFQLLWF